MFDGIVLNKRLLIDLVSGVVQCVQYFSGIKFLLSCDCNLYCFCFVFVIRVFLDLLVGWSFVYYFICWILL